MIPVLFQKHLVEEELPDLFKDVTLINSKKEASKLNFHKQYLPQKNRNKEDFPYINVILLNGERQDEQSGNMAHVLFMAGVYDDNENNQGYQDSFILINKLYQHINSKRIIKNKYVLEFPVKWMTNDDVTYPYFYTALETYWSIAKQEQSHENLYL